MPSPVLDRLRSRIARLLKVEEDHKLGIYQATLQSAEMADLNYWLQLFLAAGIATLGLIQNSAAVIIGAMLVSPLMGPIIATGLALALGDFYLGLKAVLQVAASVAASVLFAAAVVWLLPFHAVTPEIAARTQPTLLDLAVAILSGLAGAVVACRGGAGGGVTALPGVAVAVTLMPPLCVVGFGAGAGFLGPVMRGAGLLFFTNLVAIVAASFLVFLVARMDTVEVRNGVNRWQESEERRDPLYRLVQHTALRPLLGSVGTVRRRAGLLLAFLLLVFLPLRSGLQRLREENQVRGAVRAAIREAMADDVLVSEQVEPGPPVRVRVVAAGSLGAEAREDLRRDIEERTGRPVELVIQEVASRADMAALGRQIAPAAATLAELETARGQFLGTLEAALGGSWPADSAPLADYSLNLRSDGLELEVSYLSSETLGPAAEEAIQRGLETRLAVPLSLVFERIEPRRGLFRWTAGLTHPPPAATPLLDDLADLLARHAQLQCRLVFPERAASGLAQAVTSALEDRGLSGGRCRVVMAASPDPAVFAQIEKK